VISLLRTMPAEGREAPALLVAAIKAIDARAELVHVGGGHWWLGVVDSNDHREQQGEVILKFEHERGASANPRNVMLGELLREGFARVNGYTTDGDPSDEVTDYDGNRVSILADFQERDFWWNHDGGKAKFLERLKASSQDENDEASNALSLDYLINEGRSHYRREIKNRKVFGYAGETGGAGRIITL
jgi:hypothetical protein